MSFGLARVNAIVVVNAKKQTVRLTRRSRLIMKCRSGNGELYEPTRQDIFVVELFVLRRSSNTRLNDGNFINFLHNESCAKNDKNHFLQKSW